MVDGAAEVELLDDGAGREVEVGVDDLHELSVGLLSGAEGVDVDGHGLLDADGVGDLYDDAASESGGDERLGDPAAGVGGGSVDLGQILSGEGASTVGAGSSVGVNLELASSDTGITHGTSDDEASRGVQVVDDLVVEQLCGDGGLDDELVQILRDLLVGDRLVVLSGDDDGVHTYGDERSIVVLVLHGDLSLHVWAGPLERSVVAQLSELLAQTSSERPGDRHELGGLVGGITEHQTLISGSQILISTANMHSTGNIGGLLSNRD